MHCVLGIIAAVIFSNIGTYYALTHMRSIHVKDINIAVVDLLEIRNTADVYQSYIKIVEEEFKKAQKKVLDYENKLRKLDTEIKDLLQKNDPKKTKELRMKREQLIQQKQESEKLIMQIKEKLNSYFERQGDAIQAYLDEAMSYVIKKHNISILLNAEDRMNNRIVLHADKVLEITDEVRKKFNELTQEYKFETIE